MDSEIFRQGGIVCFSFHCGDNIDIVKRFQTYINTYKTMIKSIRDDYQTESMVVKTNASILETIVPVLPLITATRVVNVHLLEHLVVLYV